MAHCFRQNSVFAILAGNAVYTELPDRDFQLSDGTWVLRGMPVSEDQGSWKEWLGSIFWNRLCAANLVLLAEKPSNIPALLGAEHQRLSDDLGLIYELAHLGVGIEASSDEGAYRLLGSFENGFFDIRGVEEMRRLYRSQGAQQEPITPDCLESSVTLRDGFAKMRADQTQFTRVLRGLDTLFKGKREQAGNDRLHQFVRSLEALIVPCKGNTKKQFVHRCQTFAPAGEDTRKVLTEAYEMRSATEHLNPWDGPVEKYPLDEREEVCWKRTQQVERLACNAYERLLRSASLREHFRTDDSINGFWKLLDHQTREIWGAPLDITKELALGTE